MGKKNDLTLRYRHVYRFIHEHHVNDSTGEKWYEQKFYCDGKLEYSARMTEEQYIYSLDHPNLFRMAEMFSMGFIPVNCQEVQKDKCIWNLQGEYIENRPRGSLLSSLLEKNLQATEK